MLLEPWLEPALVVWTGLPGSGKSYKAAQKQVQWLEAGLPVISNLEVKRLPWVPFKQWGPFILLSREDCEETIIVDGEETLGLLEKVKQVVHEYPNQHVLVVVDEAHVSYNSANWKNFPKALKAFLVQHRHLKVSLLVIAQAASMLEGNFRKLAQEFRHHRNLCKDSSLGMFLWLFTTNWHIAYSVPNVGGEPCKHPKERYSREWFRIRADRASLYDSGQLHNFKAKIQFKRSRPKWGRRIVWLLLMGLLYLGFSALRAFAAYLRPDNRDAMSQAEDTGRFRTVRLKGRVISMWDDSREPDITWYELETEKGFEQVPLSRQRYGTLDNYDKVGEEITVLVPGPVYQSLAVVFERPLETSDTLQIKEKPAG